MSMISAPPPTMVAGKPLESPRRGDADARFMDVVEKQGASGHAHPSASASRTQAAPVPCPNEPHHLGQGFVGVGVPDAGHEDARLYPQRLVAHGYLDHLPRPSRSSGDGGEPMMPVRLSNSEAMGAVARTSSPRVPDRGVAPSTHGAYQPSQVGSAASRGIVSDAGSADQMLADRLPKAPSNGAMPAEWARRAAHLVHSEDGSVTVWLRDFKLGSGDVSSLVDAARATWPEAKRVMLNGQQAWSINEEGETP